ncbi:uncharacterized protein FFC1_07404 [Fusarium fujikuroi]|nr:uncharacterized protein FFC1_07404 [Fusarium fujikuroi]
MAIKIAF